MVYPAKVFCIEKEKVIEGNRETLEKVKDFNVIAQKLNSQASLLLKNHPQFPSYSSNGKKDVTRFLKHEFAVQSIPEDYLTYPLKCNLSMKRRLLELQKMSTACLNQSKCKRVSM